MEKHDFIDNLLEDVDEQSYPKILALSLYAEYYEQNSEYPIDSIQEKYILDKKIEMNIGLLKEGGIPMDYRDVEKKVRENYWRIKKEHKRR